MKAGGKVTHTHTDINSTRPRERWASTGNSFTAVLLTKASEWEQSKKECNVYGVCAVWRTVGAAHVQAINTDDRLVSDY